MNLNNSLGGHYAEFQGIVIRIRTWLLNEVHCEQILSYCFERIFPIHINHVSLGAVQSAERKSFFAIFIHFFGSSLAKSTKPTIAGMSGPAQFRLIADT